LLTLTAGVPRIVILLADSSHADVMPQRWGQAYAQQMQNVLFILTRRTFRAPNFYEDLRDTGILIKSQRVYARAKCCAGQREFLVNTSKLR